jgi:hypothetical protein
MPFFSIYLPQSYYAKYPEKLRNLQQNSQQLTTCLDIHYTLRELTCLDDEKKNDPVKKSKGVSLLRSISPSRSCKDTGISDYYCTCQNKWEIMYENFTQFHSNAAQYFVNYVNEKILSFVGSEFCEKLTLYRLNDVKIRKLSDQEEGYYLKITVVTMPNNAFYTALIKYYKNKTFSIDNPKDSISRFNEYRKQPSCLQTLILPNKTINVDLRLFCMCRKSIISKLYSKFLNLF